MTAIAGLSPIDREAVLEWLNESAADALIHEPAVGIFANERMAAAFRELAEIVSASAMSTGTAKTPKAVEGQSPASATAESRDAQPSSSESH